jgi:hypothetical protein
MSQVTMGVANSGVLHMPDITLLWVVLFLFLHLPPKLGKGD